jgi:hypothetical protein
MTIRSIKVRKSAFLLLFLGALLSIPLAAKTLSAHGAVPALVTGLLVIAAVALGPVSYLVASVVATNITIVARNATDTEFVLALAVGALLFLAWMRSVARGYEHSIPYLPVTGWALMGAYFCLSQVFPHIT